MFRVLAAFLLSALPLLAQDDLVLQHLRADYVKQSRLIRGFYQDPLLHYDAAGNLTHRAPTGSWTTSFINIESLRLHNGRIEFSGHRAIQIFNDHKRLFERHNTGITLLLTLDAPSPVNEDTLRKALAVIFVDAKEPVAPLLPESWRWVVEHLDKEGVLPKPEKKPAVAQPKPCPPDASLDQPCHVGGEVKPPKPISTPDPQFNDYGRALRIHGTIVLWTVVDETGHPRRLVIQKPLGCGFDEDALEKVKEWTFQPAIRDGRPVPVMINVQVNFGWN